MSLERSREGAGAGLEPIVAQGVSDHVQHRLRAALLSGRFQSGQRLNERMLAAELGVSTTPVKAALQRLEVDGLVRIEPRRGVYAEFDARQAEQMTLARAALEGMIIREAAPRASAGDLIVLKSHVAEMKKATAQGAVEALIGLNARFHDAIHAASGCTYLVRLLSGQEMYDHATRVALLADADERRRALREHDAIARALSERDADRAEQAMRAHILRSGRRHIAMVFRQTSEMSDDH